MQNRSFDDLTRAVAMGRSRREVIRTFMAGGAAGLAAILGDAGTSAKQEPGKKNDKDKGGGKKEKDQGGGKEKEKGAGKDKITLCHNGHSITVPEKKARGHQNHGDTLGPCEDDLEHDDVIVAPIPPFSVDVACDFVPDSAQTRCTFTALVEDDATALLSILVPAAEVCAEVTGGDAERIDADPATRVAGYQSTGDGPVVTLEFAGRVTIAGTASYWCGTAAGVFPAPGPGLTCEAATSEDTADDEATAGAANEGETSEDAETPDDLSDTTGAVVVHVAECDDATATATSDLDWYGECVSPVAGLRLILISLDDGASKQDLTGASDGDGELRFSQLPPGSYNLDAVDAVWRHAESDNVDEDGNLIVEAGQRCHVWLFV